MYIGILITQGVLIILLIAILLRKNKFESPEILAKIAGFEASLQKTDSLLREEMGRNRDEFNKNSRELREETGNSFKSFQDSLAARMTESFTLQKEQFTDFSQRMDKTFEMLESRLKEVRTQLDEDAKTNRTETKSNLGSFEEKFVSNVKEFNDLQKQKFDSLITNLSDMNKSVETRLERLREAIELQLKTLREENSKKLDEMRNVVDEKLQTTLEKRLGESFKQVSERLEQVHQGLGDMKNLANGVGDLKKVLSNVKTRGMLGEYQLANLLEQIFSPEQYSTNVQCKENSQSRVEFAIKLPGRDDDNKQVYLPIDAKFPIEDYYRLQEAYELGDLIKIEAVRKELGNKIKSSAKEISDKYINPPVTTDFAILFLPSEGLYAEIISKTELLEQIQREYRVVVSGPTTLGALLNSLQMGFKTFAIHKRSSEVWQILGAVKTEFGKFGKVLQEAQRNITGANKKLDDLIGARTRAIERKLRDVEELPIVEGKNLLPDK